MQVTCAWQLSCAMSCLLVHAALAVSCTEVAVVLFVIGCRADGSYSGNPGSGGGSGGPPPPGADMDISAAELVNRLSFHVSAVKGAAAAWCSCFAVFY